MNSQKKKLRTSVDNQESAVRTFSNKRMEQVKFEELIISIGKPCIYRHRKSCDHLFVFNDVR